MWNLRFIMFAGFDMNVPTSSLLGLTVLTLFGFILSNCTIMTKTSAVPTLGKSTWTSFDGKEMPWLSSEVPPGKTLRAVVITVHGLSGAASDFWPIAESWPKQGIAVYGVELRGMGNDPDKSARGNITSGDVWRKDLSTFHQLVRAAHPHVPVFWYAESLGSLIAVHALAEMTDAGVPAGLILSSPAAGLKMEPNIGKELFVWAAIKLAPGVRVNLEKLAGVKDKDIRMTTGSTHEAQMAKTPHFVAKLTLRLLGEVDEMIRALRAAAKKTCVPVLVLATPNDVIASQQQVRNFFDALATKDKTLLWYPRSYHLLLHDVQREQVVGDATRWIESKLRK